MSIIRAVAKKAYVSLCNTLSVKKLHITESLIYHPTRWKFASHIRDFNRLACLQLAAQDIERRKTAGALAEVGVYRGGFAAHVNAIFPDRKLYLFDTFEGFDARDVKDEQSRGLSKGGQDFSATSVEYVMSQMPHPQQCVPMRGYFPETANGLEEKFAFVSLDTDLYAPIYSGLEWFYPRLSHGGYIFVHDFNNELYPGASEAVIDYCGKHQIGYALLPDGGGTAVVSR